MAGSQPTISRLRRLRETAVSVLLRRHKPSGQSNPIMAAIIGDHISDQIRVFGLYERDQLEFLQQNILDLEACRHKVALDVGANIGNHSIFLSRLFAKVVAFEPNPLAQVLLNINLQLNSVENVDVRPVGLSDCESAACLSIPVGNLGAAHLIEDVATGPTNVEHIKLVVGDDALEPSHPIGFIKIDVEGSEAKALAGLRTTIQRHRPIIMMEQLSTQIDATSGKSPAFAILMDMGYRAWELRYSSSNSRISRVISPLILRQAALRMVAIESLEPRNYPVLIFRQADSGTTTV